MGAWHAHRRFRPLGVEWIRRVRTREKVIYITFDDGPLPEITPWVLDTLQRFGAQATFFCIGANIEAHPEIFARIQAEGHGVGNHTYLHQNGWQTGHHSYVRDALRCERLTHNALFRPPYGRITLSQARTLGRRLKLVFWDVLSEDFDGRRAPSQIVRNVIARSRPGSIIVFHDNLLSEERMRYAFPRVLEHFARLGYHFPPLPGSTTGSPASRQASMPPSSS